jgi:AcrR family transcriptional regulator
MQEKRTYRLKARAKRQDATRRRIVEATAALHEEVGPSHTTISAIAARAGVERLTVYRHFPDEGDLLQACQAHFIGAHPLPDLATWTAETDSTERLRAALTSLYAYYHDTEAMTANILRDAPAIPALAELIREIPHYLAAARDILAAGWTIPDERRQARHVSPLLLAALGHALEFDTWRSLARHQGLSDDQAVELMVTLVSCLAHGEVH